MPALELRPCAFVVALAACLAPPLAARADITGRVKLVGRAPRVRPVDVRADPACRPYAREASTAAMRVTDGALADVFVYLEGAARPEVAGPPKAARLAVRHCHIEPRVIGVQVGQKLTIENHDETLYSVRIRGGGAETVRRLPAQGTRFTHRFTAPQAMARIACDVHGWVVANVGVLDHPYFAVSDEAGRFRIDTRGLADGTYTLRAWHEVLGTQAATLVVKDGEARIDLTFGRS